METAVKKLTRLASTLALVLTICLSQTPARAQIGGFGGGEDMLTTRAPVLEIMKKKMGEKRFGELMKTVGPVAAKMMDGNGSFDIGSFDIGSLGGIEQFVTDGTIQSLIGTATSSGGGRNSKRRHHAPD